MAQLTINTPRRHATRLELWSRGGGRPCMGSIRSPSDRRKRSFMNVPRYRYMDMDTCIAHVKSCCSSYSV
eukprot:183473-Prymnesium_polylepis.2